MKALFERFHIFLLLSVLWSSFGWSRGEMILIGGGIRPKSIISKIIGLSRGKILVVPLADEFPMVVGPMMVEEFYNNGADRVELFKCDYPDIDRSECIDQISSAGLVYFTGGDQVRLMRAFKGSKALQLIRKRFKKDLSLAGTSAGTTIMNNIMIAGVLFKDDPRGVKPGMAETYKGFGLLKNIIVDQHFLARNRTNRLLSTVLEKPNLVGVGIDESTAIYLKSEDYFEVLGESKVMIIDARNAKIEKDRNGYFKTTGVTKTLLQSGDGYHLNH